VTKWRVWILTTVAAVGGAYILGVTAPVRAASVVTYTLENAELIGGDDVTGSIDYDVEDEEILGADLTISSTSGSEVEVIDTVIDADRSSVSFSGSGGISFLAVASDLTGAAGQEVAIDTEESYISEPGYTVAFVQGSVTDGSAGPSSVPEPSSIMATVTAVTLGVVLRRMKRGAALLERQR